MANPLQPKVIKVLKEEYGAFVINVVSSSVSGDMDVVACVPVTIGIMPGIVHGLFYGFEIKWRKDVPSELQKQKINKLIDAQGRGFFIRSIEQLRYVIDNDIEPERYKLKPKMEL